MIQSSAKTGLQTKANLTCSFVTLFLCLALPPALASQGPAQASENSGEKPDDNQAVLRPSKKSSRERSRGISLTEDTLAMARMLKIEDAMNELKSLSQQTGKSPSSDQLIRVMYLRQQCSRATQFASLELEEALSNIDGDLSYTNMEYSLFLAKHDRSVNLNNAATFLTAGTLGVLDSASGIRYAAPVPNIFGITGNAAAVAIPLWGLRPRKYKSIQSNDGGNMLAPIFDLSYEGEGYDPLVWEYLNTRALDEDDKLTRRQKLVDRWKRFRHLDMEAKTKDEVKALAGVANNKTVTLDLLKTRSELLVELRAEVQSMYADLSDLNTELMKY